MSITPADLARYRASAERVLVERCQIRRYSGGTTPLDLDATERVAEDVPCRVTAGARELYPTATIPNQPVREWLLRVPAGTEVQCNDLLLLDDGQRIYVVIHPEGPRSLVAGTLATSCVLSAEGGQLGDAYLRPNATVSSVRPSAYGGLSSGYDARRVHLIFAQVNPAAPLERLTGGVATLAVGMVDLVDADWRQGDGCTILSLDGASTLPAEPGFTVGGVVRRPLPFACTEIDLSAPV